MSTLTRGPETWPWDPVGWWQSLHDRVSRGLICKTSLCAKWSQTATYGAWYSKTSFLSGRDRTQGLCVLRRSGSEAKTLWIGGGAPPPPSNSLLLARDGKQSSTVIRSHQCCWVKKSAITPADLGCTPSVSLRRARAEVCRWITSQAGGTLR